MAAITFTGDMHFGDTNGQHLFDSTIQETCRESNYVVVNIEGPITSSPPRQLPGFVLHSTPGSQATLELFGNNVFDLANNHIMDHGIAGLRDTVRVAMKHGWICMGAGENLAEASKPCVLSDGKVTVGVVGVCGEGVPFAGKASPGVWGDKPESFIRQQIRKLKTQVRWVVLVYHGGEEFTHIPLPARRKKLLRYLSYGADVVVAHHAHCVQRYEQVGGKLLFYGLGNLVFNLDHHRHIEGTNDSVLLTLQFSDQSITFRPLFTRHDCEGQRVSSLPCNPEFHEVTPESYAMEWGMEAARRLHTYWETGHEQLVRNNWKQQVFYYWKKLRRSIGLLYICISDKHGLTRPYILGGVMYYLKNRVRPGTCAIPAS